jgi:hypothetical protein
MLDRRHPATFILVRMIAVRTTAVLPIRKHVMNKPSIQLTSPILSGDAAVWFSAYGFGWGYRAFASPFEAICERLGAADMTDRQIRLAFELGKRRILKAIEPSAETPYEGLRVVLPAGRL